MFCKLISLILLNLVVIDTIHGESAWTKRSGLSMPGLIQSPRTSVDNCLWVCLAVPNCTFAEFNTKTYPPCWIQADENLDTNVKNLIPDESVTSFELDREGVISGKKCWKTSPGYHFPGLRHMWFYSLEVCLTYCMVVDVCNVADFDTNTNPHCWVQEGMVNHTIEEASLVPMSSTTNYILDRTCLVP